jgi:hypothetical protein
MLLFAKAYDKQPGVAIVALVITLAVMYWAVFHGGGDKRHWE